MATPLYHVQFHEKHVLVISDPNSDMNFNMTSKINFNTHFEMNFSGVLMATPHYCICCTSYDSEVLTATPHYCICRGAHGYPALLYLSELLTATPHYCIFQMNYLTICVTSVLMLGNFWNEIENESQNAF